MVVKDVYRLTQAFPKEELYGLTSQMRRAAVSIPSNIAEGSRRTRLENRQFLRISFASGAELETQLEVSRQLHYLSERDYQQITGLLEEVMKMLNVMISKKS